MQSFKSRLLDLSIIRSRFEEESFIFMLLPGDQSRTIYSPRRNQGGSTSKFEREMDDIPLTTESWGNDFSQLRSGTAPLSASRASMAAYSSAGGQPFPAAASAASHPSPQHHHHQQLQRNYPSAAAGSSSSSSSTTTTFSSAFASSSGGAIPQGMERGRQMPLNPFQRSPTTLRKPPPH